MQKRAPTLANILVIVLFALSCFGLLLFLWESFGGPVPLKPKGYRFTIEFARTLALAEQSDVRISGVNVGHVISLEHNRDGLTHATVELASKYAPIPSNTRVTLREKTLLGETYVQLLPPEVAAASLPDNGELAIAHVEPSLTLDDLLSTFTAETRAAFQQWMQSQAEGIGGRGEQINAGFAETQPFIEDSNKLVGIVASQEGALTATIHNIGVVLDALTAREGQYRGFLENGEAATHALAEGSQGWAEFIRLAPAFERNAQAGLRSFDAFAVNTEPFLDQFRPAQEQLTPLLRALEPFTPPFNSLLTSLGPFTQAGKKGLPQTKKIFDLLVPLLGETSTALHNFNPFFQYLSEYLPELQGLFANATAAAQTHGKNTNIPGGPQQHQLKAMNVLGPEGLSVYPQRVGTNRGNAYPQPGAFRTLASGLQVFSSASCANSAPSVSGPALGSLTQSIIEQLIEDRVVNAPESASNSVVAPACVQQGPFTFNGQISQFPHVTP